jgi:hypothetical protein
MQALELSADGLRETEGMVKISNEVPVSGDNCPE